MMALSLMAAALAAPALSVSAGLETTINDPYLSRQGLRAGVGAAPWPWLEVGLMGAVHPLATERSSSLRTTEVLGALGVTPGVSPVRARAALTLDLPVLRTEVGTSAVSLGPAIQAGAIYSVDDADALGVHTDDEAYSATARQWHLAPGYGLVAEASGAQLGLRLRLERTPYVEEVQTTLQMDRRLWWAGAELTWRP